jgi:peptidyl-prolyl cis-trans isomerase D
MSIIQNIRDKYARVAVVAIALALVGFILTDYFSGRGRGGGPTGGNTVGSVNGKKITAEDFNRKVQMYEDQLKSQGMPQNAATSFQAINNTWDQEVSRLLFAEEFDKLGMRIENKELGDILYGPNMPQDLKQQLTDPQTGVFDPVAAKRQVDEMLKSSSTPQEQKDRFNSYVFALEQQRKMDKYLSLLANTINHPRWFVEKQNADNSLIAKISMVREVYSSIPDSTVTISDKEIQDYIDDNKNDFKQDESRSISYVTFSAAPSRADSLSARERVLAVKPALDTTLDIQNLLMREGVTNFYDGYINGKTIQVAAKDSIFKTPVGGVYGPYLDGNTYTLAKVIAARPMPDSAKVRHILVSNQNRDTLAAKKLIDSLQTAIAQGSNFDSLAAKFSEDGASKDKGGIYDNVFSGQMVAPFNDFIFLNPVGTKGVVKTDFGYHYIEILSQTGGGLGYKIAYVSKDIFASEETLAEALNKASEFAGDSRDQKTFDANYDKKLKPLGQQKGVATDILPIDASIRGVGVSRQFVKAIYDAKLGKVVGPEMVDDQYVVAVVTEVNEEGTASVAKARTVVEPVLRNKKKAQMLKQKAGKVTTLEAVATAWGGKQVEVADSIRMQPTNNNPVLGYEPRVSGAAFNPNNKGKVVPEILEGISGVYAIRVENVSATPVTQGDINEQRRSMSVQQRQQVTNPQSPAYPANYLKKAAKINDKRNEIY